MSAVTSLTNAVTSGDQETVVALLSSGADVNETTGGGQSALILAVIFGHTNLVRLLINAGADPQLRDNLGLNAIEWAKRRGAREALEILNGTPPTIAVTEPEPDSPQPVEADATAKTPAEVENPETASDDERSRKWLAGLRQRLDEQERRRATADEASDQIEEVAAPAEQPQISVMPPSMARVFEPPVALPAQKGKRKRCPRCNAIYNGDLLSYCAHHIVPLVDADDLIITETPPKLNVPLFWILVLVALSGSIVVGSIITTFLFRSPEAPAQVAPPPPTVQKGIPEVGGDLIGKAVSLPEAECPLSGSQHLAGSVIVNVKVDREGLVYWASGSGGDWLMRGAATEAAMKSTFAPDKLRGRESEGTITYTFKPQ